MPRKFTDTDKRRWLESFEGGRSEKQIAREDAKCDPRTVKRGIEEARTKQDARLARAELLKEALRKHQDSLLKELDEILSSLALPTEGYVPLPWHYGGDRILTEIDIETGKKQTRDVSESPAASTAGEGVVRRLLREHLKNNRLWKALARWRKAYTAHLADRMLLQHRVVAATQGRTGRKLVDGRNVPRPFIYADNTGDLFFRAAVSQALGTRKMANLESDIAANSASGDVRYQSMVLAEAPGEEERVKAGLLAALGEIKASPEAASIADSHRLLQEEAVGVREVVENIKLLGWIQGRCEICRRLGM